MRLTEYRFDELLEAIGAKTPAPGGGAVAAAVGAIGVALGKMVIEYSIRKSTPDDARAAFENAREQLVKHTKALTDAGDEDAAAYSEVNRLQKLPEDDPERQSKWGEAVARAIAAPQNVIDEATTVLNLLDELKPNCNKWLLSDLAISARLCATAVQAAAWNVRVNLPLLDDEAEQAARSRDLDAVLTHAHQIALEIEQFCQ